MHTVTNTVFEEGIYDDETGEDKTDDLIGNLIFNAIEITASDVSSSNIRLANISFNTQSNVSVSLLIGDQEYRSEGTVHTFAVTIPDQLSTYTINIEDANEHTSTITKDIEVKQSCNMFSYVGDISPHLPILIPILQDILDNLGDYCESLDIYLFGGIDYEKYFNKQSIFSLEEATAEEMFDSLYDYYLLHKEELMEHWPVLTEDELLVIYILNVVNRLWHFGNFIYPHAPGCVRVNETITAEEGDFIFDYADDGTPIYFKYASDMTDYLNSNIGCCTDHAYITKLLLDEGGYIARRLVSPGHWFAEALIGDDWYTLDASFGVLVKSSIEEMKVEKKRTAYVFVSPYMVEKHPLIYPEYTKYTISLGLELPITDEYVYVYGKSKSVGLGDAIIY